MPVTTLFDESHFDPNHFDTKKQYSVTIEEIAAIPDPKANPPVPFSREAKLVSKAVLVGFPVLEYSYS